MSFGQPKVARAIETKILNFLYKVTVKDPILRNRRIHADKPKIRSNRIIKLSLNISACDHIASLYI